MPNAHAPRLTSIATLLQEVLERLERIEAKLDAKAMPRSTGAPPIDDADALAEVRKLIAAGLPEWQALKATAANLGGSVNANRQRLKRKLHSGSQTSTPLCL